MHVAQIRKECTNYFRSEYLRRVDSSWVAGTFQQTNVELNGNVSKAGKLVHAWSSRQNKATW